MINSLASRNDAKRGLGEKNERKMKGRSVGLNF
jgi:hypothetical protein